MNSSTLLQWSSFLGGLSELSTVKKHLLGAGREVLMAVQGLLGVVEQSVSGQRTETDQERTIETIVRYAKQTIQEISKKLPPGDAGGYPALHRKVMKSILDVLEQEIKKNGRLKTQKAQIKVEALQAIRHVLIKEVLEGVEGEAS